VLGARVWDLTPEDETVLKVYLRHVSHRLMKEIRNRDGDTYSAREDLSVWEDFGYASISLEAPPEKFRSILQKVQAVFRTEAEQGGFTPVQFTEAMELYRSRFALKDRDSETLLRLQEEQDRFRRIYRTQRTPYQVYASLDAAQFTGRLKHLFQPGRQYASLTEPPALFVFEYFVWIAGFLIALFWAIKRLLTSRFEHTQIRWVRKLAFPPLWSLEMLAALAGAVFGLGVVGVVNHFTVRSAFLQSSFVRSEYLLDFVRIALVLTSSILVLAAVPRKLMVCGDWLVIKGVAFASRRIPLQDVESTELMSLWKSFLSFRVLWRVKWRHYFVDPRFWRRGLLVNLRDGRSYFFSMSDSDASHLELSQVFNQLRGSQLSG
jgi:hypothetical protein